MSEGREGGGWANNGTARWGRKAAAVLDELNPGWYRTAVVTDCPDCFVRPILSRLMRDGGCGKEARKP